MCLSEQGKSLIQPEYSDQFRKLKIATVLSYNNYNPCAFLPIIPILLFKETFPTIQNLIQD